MPTFLIEVRDSDGNDCTVFDALVTAESKGKALDKLWAQLEQDYPDDVGDGGDGTFHSCICSCNHTAGNGLKFVTGVCADCQESWECSHGGILVNSENVTEYATEALAWDARSRYHSVIDLTEH